jgi:hypothetical protein
VPGERGAPAARGRVPDLRGAGGGCAGDEAVAGWRPRNFILIICIFFCIFIDVRCL